MIFQQIQGQSEETWIFNKPERWSRKQEVSSSQTNLGNIPRRVISEISRQTQHIHPKNRIDHPSAQTNNEGWQATKQEIQAEPSSVKLVIHEIEIKIDQEAAYTHPKKHPTVCPQTSGKDLFKSLPSLSLKLL